MSYCEDCGLSSCYERGGPYCEKGLARRAKPRRIEPPLVNRIIVVDEATTYCFVGSPPALDREWIEYVPDPFGMDLVAAERSRHDH